MKKKSLDSTHHASAHHHQSHHKPRKRFGQNFLQNDAIIQNIIRHIHPKKNDHLVEIGPGLGALTFPILSEIKKMDVVEIDRDLIPGLQMHCPTECELSIHEADALKFSFSSLKTDDRKLRIIGNLPYNISTPILFHLLKERDVIEDMHFMLQLELVERACAEPGSRTYGRLSVMLQVFCETTILMHVPPSAFFPEPKVDSAIIRLTPHRVDPYPDVNIARLEALVGAAFNQRRKSLSNSIKNFLSLDEIRSIGIDPQLRAEQISVRDFVRLSEI